MRLRLEKIMSDSVFDAGLTRSALQSIGLDAPAVRALSDSNAVRPNLHFVKEPAATGTEPVNDVDPGLDIVNVAFGLDATYLPHAGVVITSMIANAPGAHFRFLILHEGISAEDRSEFERCGSSHQFLWLRIEQSSVLAMAGKRHISRASYFRLMISELAPADMTRVIYLDGDLVISGDLRELYRTDLADHAIGAVADVGMDDRAFAERFGLAHQRLGYFNAGVLLINLAAIRQSGAFLKALDLLEMRKDEMEYSDQCALNLVFWQRWKALDILWNVQRRMLMPNEGKPCFAEKTEMKSGQRPKIIHFTEQNKPWSTDAWHPLIWTYYRYLDKTPYRARVRTMAQVTLIREVRRRVKTFFNWQRLRAN
jgi:lipopolysaccharide biosynthesis glycosyltransferase